MFEIEEAFSLMTATQLQLHDVRGRVAERSVGDRHEVHGLATHSFIYIAKITV
jgi:hypothetical protein